MDKAEMIYRAERFWLEDPKKEPPKKCKCTGRVCTKCNPGPCGSRKEEE